MFFCRILPDEPLKRLLPSGDWKPTEAVVDPTGHQLASVWRSTVGDIVLPFDPDEAVVAFWSERWMIETQGRKALVKRAAVAAYYMGRPLLPRAVQIAARRALSRFQARRSFPGWPIETTLHDLYEQLLDWLGEISGGPIPYLAPWPRGYDWAFVLTHDVEHESGYRDLARLRDVELSHGYRSAWYLVPERDYVVEDTVVEELRKQGFEVGVHGLHHDGRDLASAATFEERLPAIRQWRERWGATGFRSPATHRNWTLMPRLGFDYDSSSFDTDPFEPQPGGCCSWWPFFNGELVELPITLTMDHTLFVILRQDEALWREKAAFLRTRGGLALMLTHPDYMGDAARLAAYERLLAEFARDETVWRALPSEVSAWWRRRATSTIKPDGQGWRVAGPAACEATIHEHLTGGPL